jgi:hypothetical protein
MIEPAVECIRDLSRRYRWKTFAERAKQTAGAQTSDAPDSPRYTKQCKWIDTAHSASPPEQNTTNADSRNVFEALTDWPKASNVQRIQANWPKFEFRCFVFHRYHDLITPQSELTCTWTGKASMLLTVADKRDRASRQHQQGLVTINKTCLKRTWKRAHLPIRCSIEVDWGDNDVIN